jgi:hypothetical protein
MGLAEKRIQQDFVETRVPDALKKLAEDTDGATAQLKVDIDWDTILTDKDALDNLWTVWEQPLYAIQDVCQDAMGKDAIKSSLKVVIIKNVREDDKISAAFKDGVLTVQMNLRDGAAGTPGWGEIKKVLEASF